MGNFDPPVRPSASLAWRRTRLATNSDGQQAGRVLVVSDDESVRRALATLATVEGCEARATGHGTAAMELLRSWRPAMLLLDLDVVDQRADRALRAYVGAVGSDVPVVVVADFDLSDERVAELGAVAALPKPFAVVDLLNLLKQYAHCS